ncbi:MAG: hypothetical protein KDA80_12170 [Planctomycetaceae bacterium]|nr:hypothetical protein [Planctomycetaceae bacterium]
MPLPHDEESYGTTTLSAAIELPEGKIIAECMPQRNRSQCGHGGGSSWGMGWFWKVASMAVVR